MSIIQVSDLENFQSKTLIYLTQSKFYSLIPGSFVYQVPDRFSTMVSEMRKLQLDKFPIILYDEGDMQLASQTFCILKALQYPVLVIYGGISAYLDSGLELVDDEIGRLTYDEFPAEINSDMLQNFEFGSITVKSFPFNVFEVIGNDFSKERLKKLLEVHDMISWDCENVMAGPGAALLALCLDFIAGMKVKVFIGDWFEVDTPKRKITLNESFHTVPESVYFDPVEGSEREGEEVEIQDVVINYYKVPEIQANRFSVAYQCSKYGGASCRNCNIL